MLEILYDSLLILMYMHSIYHPWHTYYTATGYPTPLLPFIANGIPGVLPVMAKAHSASVQAMMSIYLPLLQRTK